MNGCCRANLQSYVNEFMWRQWHNVGRVEAFEKIFEEIGEYYPANKLKLVDLEIERENDLSFMEWKEDEEIDGTWSQSRLEVEKEKDESESEKEKDG